MISDQDRSLYKNIKPDDSLRQRILDKDYAANAKKPKRLSLRAITGAGAAIAAAAAILMIVNPFGIDQKSSSLTLSISDDSAIPVLTDGVMVNNTIVTNPSMARTLLSTEEPNSPEYCAIPLVLDEDALVSVTDGILVDEDYLTDYNYADINAYLSALGQSTQDQANSKPFGKTTQGSMKANESFYWVIPAVLRSNGNAFIALHIEAADGYMLNAQPTHTEQYCSYTLYENDYNDWYLKPAK